jgi:hypothetical protein
LLCFKYLKTVADSTALSQNFLITLFRDSL